MSHLPTTTAGVRYVSQPEFDDAAFGVQVWLIEVEVDGPSPNIATAVRFPGVVTVAQKNAAVRSIDNAHLSVYEPLVTPLADTAIQISGQPT